jgi:hypothetical protein
LKKTLLTPLLIFKLLFFVSLGNLLLNFGTTETILAGSSKGSEQISTFLVLLILIATGLEGSWDETAVA